MPDDDRDVIAWAAVATGELARVRAALRDGRSSLVVEQVNAGLLLLANVEATAWSLLGQAYEQLHDLVAAREAWAKTATLYEPRMVGSMPIDDVRDLALALLAADRPEVAAELATAAEGRGIDVALLTVLADANERLGERRPAAIAHARAGTVIMESGRAEEAQRHFLEASRLDPTEPAYAVGRARALLAAGEIGDAERVLVEAADLFTTGSLSRGVLATAAEIARLRGDLPAAQVLIEEAGTAGDDPWVEQVRARMLLDLGQIDEAEVAIDLAVAETPNDAGLLIDCADVMLRAGRTAEAVDALERAVDLCPDVARFVFALGNGLAAGGRLEDAVAAYDRALLLEPSAAAWRERGLVLMALNRNADAIGSFDEALRLLPADAAAHLQRGEALRQEGRLEDALAAVDASIAFDRVNADSQNGQAHAVRGLLLAELDRPEEAVQALQLALMLEPTLTWVLSVEARLLAGMGCHDDASATLQAALVLTPDDPDLLALRARLRFIAGQAEASLADANQALAAMTAAASSTNEGLQTQLHILRAHSLGLLGRFDEAVGAWDLAINLDPGGSDLLVARAEARSAAGDLEGADADLDSALARLAAGDRRRAVALAARGEVARLRGHYDDALVYLEGALDVAPGVDPDDASTWAYALATRGQVHRALGHRDAAIVDLREAAVSVPEPWIARELALALAEGAAPDELREALEVLDEASRRAGDRDTLDTRAEILRLLGRPAEGLTAIDRYLASAPNALGALGTRCALLVDLGRFQEAAVLGGEVLDRVPTYVFVRKALVCALSGLGRISAALEECRVLLDASLGDSWAEATLGGLLALVGRHREAVDVLTPLLDARPSDGLVSGTAGYCRARLGQFDDAAPLLAVAVREAPEVAWHWEAQGHVLDRLGRADEARACYRRVVERADDGTVADPDTLAVAGWCWHRLGNQERAGELLQQALLASPDNISTRFSLALVLLAAGRAEVALDEYRGAIAVARASDDRDRAREVLAVARDDLAEEAALDLFAKPQAAERAAAMLTAAIDELSSI